MCTNAALQTLRISTQIQTHIYTKTYIHTHVCTTQAHLNVHQHSPQDITYQRTPKYKYTQYTYIHTH